MMSRITPRGQRIDIEIDGHQSAEGIRYSDALALLDKAYTNEIASLLGEMRGYRAAVEAALVQAENALERMKELIEAAEERHVEGGGH